MGFDDEGVAVEGRADTDVGGRAIGALTEARFGDVNSDGGEEFLVGSEVEGGENDFRAGAGAGANLAGESEGPAEKSGGASNVPGANMSANGGAGDNFPAADDRWDDADVEAVLAGEAGEELNVAGMAMAEAEVSTDEDGAHGELVEEDAGEKSLGGEAGELEVEAEDENGVEAGAVELCEALCQGADLRRGVGGAKDFEGERVEGDSGGDGGGGAGVFEDAAEDFLVAQVDAVEIADGKRGGSR
ncbi:MAG: hypothetical protein AABX36_00540 [Candidatus Thermoplasmatota archaeon]